MERKAISSDRSISSHKPEDKKYFVAVKNQPKLFLMVRPTETKSWMYRYYPPSNPKQSIISSPAALIKSQLAKSSYGHRPAITKPKDLAKLLRAIEALECDLNTINSLRLLAMLFVRNGDLRRMRWDELNLEAGRWLLKPLKGQGKVR